MSEAPKLKIRRTLVMLFVLSLLSVGAYVVETPSAFLFALIPLAYTIPALFGSSLNPVRCLRFSYSGTSCCSSSSCDACDVRKLNWSAAECSNLPSHTICHQWNSTPMATFAPLGVCAEDSHARIARRSTSAA